MFLGRRCRRELITWRPVGDRELRARQRGRVGNVGPWACSWCGTWWDDHPEPKIYRMAEREQNKTGPSIP